jgi:hypothetical protein
MKQKFSKKSVEETNGLQEYNEFTRYLEDAKQLIYTLQVMGLEETKKDVDLCAFKKELSPFFLDMVSRVNDLVSRNLIEAYHLIRRRIVV